MYEWPETHLFCSVPIAFSFISQKSLCNDNSYHYCITDFNLLCFIILDSYYSKHFSSFCIYYLEKELKTNTPFAFPLAIFPRGGCRKNMDLRRLFKKFEFFTLKTISFQNLFNPPAWSFVHFFCQDNNSRCPLFTKHKRKKESEKVKRLIKRLEEIQMMRRA